MWKSNFRQTQFDHINRTAFSHINNIERLTIKIKGCITTSIYKPPNIDFNLKSQQISQTVLQEQYLLILTVKVSSGDFQLIDQDGEKVQEWAESELLKLIHDSKLPTSIIYQHSCFIILYFYLLPKRIRIKNYCATPVTARVYREQSTPFKH